MKVIDLRALSLLAILATNGGLAANAAEPNGGAPVAPPSVDSLRPQSAPTAEPTVSLTQVEIDRLMKAEFKKGEFAFGAQEEAAKVQDIYEKLKATFKPPVSPKTESPAKP